MERRELEEIERFLTSVGKGSLYAYFGVGASAPIEDVEEAIKRRRTWAQGQQSNPKYKGEALFLIKHNTLLRRVLLEEGDEYRGHVRDSATHRNLDVLTLFIRGTLHDGQLSPQAEVAIHHQGRQLELSEGVVSARIEEILRELGATRDATDDDLHAGTSSVDYYAVLEVGPDATTADIEAAYRSRYRWARNLRDHDRAAEVLGQLDEAWRIFRDPQRRKRYDALRADMQELTDEVERRHASVIGLLASPAGPPPSTGEVSLSGLRREATAPPRTPSPVRGSPTAPPGTPTPVRTAPPGTPTPIRTAPPAPPASPPVSQAVPTSPVAPSPAEIKGRTLGLADGPQTVRTRGPRLAVDGGDALSFTVGRQRVQHALTVRNVGTGRMPGRVSSDRDWLEVVQPKLDPTLESQSVPLALRPEKMPWGRSIAQVTVATDHGERRVISVQVEHRSGLPVLAALFVGLVVLVGLAGAVAWVALGRLVEPATQGAGAEGGAVPAVPSP